MLSVINSLLLRRWSVALLVTALLVVAGSSTVLPEAVASPVSASGIVPAIDEPIPAAPTITGVTPTMGAAGTTVTIEGSGFGASTGENEIRLNGVAVPISEASPTRLLATIPAGAASGPLRVTSPGGMVSSADFVVPPSGYAVGDIDSVTRLTAGGDIVTSTVATSGKVGLLLFDGKAGQRISLLLSAGTVGTSSCCAMKVSIRRPDGSVLVSPGYQSKSGGYIDVQSLSQTGTYTVVIDPEGTATGSVKATLYDVPADTTQAVVAGGEPVTVSTSTPGQATGATFTATAGQRVSIRLTASSFGTSSCCGAKISVLRPDGTTLYSPTYFGTSGGWIDTLSLPQAGTYTLRIDPEATAVGSAAITLHDVPADPEADISADGDTVKVTTSVPGQNALLRFPGEAGARIALQTTAVSFGTSSCCGARLSIVKPDGTNLYAPQYVGTSGGWTDVLALPATGQYTIKADPDGANIGSATFRLLFVPADQVLQTTADGTKITAQTTVPGQNSLVEFTGEAGQAISLQAAPVAFGTSSCCSAKLSVLAPSGNPVVSATYIGTSSGFIDRFVLPVTGTYVVKFDPEGTNTGSAGLQVFTVPADPAPEVIPGGDPVVVTTTIPGQNARPTFAGKASQRVSIQLSKASFGTSSCCGAKVSLVGPSGQSVLSATSFGTGGLSRDVLLPADGTYGLVLDPQGSVVGSVTVKVTSGPSAPSVTSTTHPDSSTSYESGDFAASWTPPGDPAALRGYSVVIDDKPSTIPAEAVSQSTTSIGKSVEQGQWYLHVRAIDSAGFGGATTHFPFRYDVSGPEMPVISSTSHPDSEKSYRATTLDATWQEPADASGIAGYAVVLDSSPTTVPSESITQTERTVSANVAEGTAYLHVRAVDTAGHWGATGTFKVTVDTTGPAAPELASSTHPDPETTYTSPALVASWPPADDPAGIAGYAVVLDKVADTTPGEKVTQTESSYSTTIGGGVWHLHVRSIDSAGNGGPTAHLRINVDDANGTGPTLVTTNIVEDTVWGPQGSPYVIEDSLRITETASLTLLPGTIVKFKRADRYGSITVMGQLLALGTPTQRVTITSFKDDTVGGDTNGDGAASAPARGDWYHMIFYGSDAFMPTTQRPASVVDYADIRYGGYGSGVFMCSAYGSIVAASKSRLVVSNSHISESQWSNIHSSNTYQQASFLGVYNNHFSAGNCGVVVRTGDIVGNTFDASFREYAFMSNSPDKVRFQYNTVKGVTLVVGSAPTREQADVRYNHFIGQTKDWGAADQDLTDYTLNWWGYDLNAEQLPQCMSTAAMQAHNPPIAYTFTTECIESGGSGTAHPTGYFTGVLPALSSPPGSLPASLREASAPRLGPVNTNSGALTYSVEDLALEDAGKLISAVRTYRSDRSSGSELGAGWFTAFDEKLSANGDVGTLSTATGDLPFTNDAAAGAVPAAGVSAGFTTGPDGSSVTTTDQTTYQFDLKGELTGMLLGDPGHKIDVDRVDGKLSKVTGSSGRSLSYARSDGRLQSITDSEGRSTSFAYTGGRVASATGIDGKTTNYSYDTEGRLTKVTTPSGRLGLSVGYDSQGRVVWVEQPGVGRSNITYEPGRQRSVLERADGTRVDQEYDGYGRLVQERIRGGAGTHTVYDGEGRKVVAVQGVPSVPMVRYSAAASATWYDGRGNPAMNIDAVGRTTISTFNAKHKPLVTTRADGSTVARAYDDDGRLTSVTDPAGKRWAYTHNDRGQITSQTDPLERRTTLAYEDDGDLASLTDTYGGTTRFARDGLGRPTTITDAVGSVRRVDYTVWGESKKVTRPRGGVSTVEFDADRQMVKATDPEGGVTRYERDGAGRVAATVDPLGGRTAAEYDAIGRAVKATDARGNTYQRTYTVDGFAATATGPDGSTVKTEHDPLGRELRVTDALGNVTQQTFDRTGVLLKRETADGAVHAYALDAQGRPTKYTAPDGGVWTTAYAPNDRPESTTDPLARTTRTSYDAVGRPVSTTDAAGTLTETAYNDDTRTATTSDPVGTLGAATLDALGRVVRESDARSGVTTTAYDDDGNVASVKDPEGGVRRFEYDLAGRLTAEIDPEGRRTTATLDAAGRITTLTHPGAASETFAYDDNGNLISRVDRVGKTWHFVFDKANRVISETDPLDHATTHQYDAAGRQTRTTDPTNRAEVREYDALGRLTAQRDNAGSAWAYTYDLAGNLSASQDPAGVKLTGTWDKAGQLTRVAGGPSGRTDLVYDKLGHVVTRTDAAGKVTAYAYDSRSRVTKETDPLGQVTTFGYDASGNLTERRSPTGRVEKWTHTANDALLTARDGAGNTSTYAYDKSGALASLKLAGGGTYTYAYDAAGRLAKETTPTGAATAYGYDYEGKLTKRTLPSGDQVSATYDDAGRLVSEEAGDVTRSFEYDPAGRMTTAVTGGTSLVFGYNSRGLLSTSTDSIGTTTYEYDAAQRLVQHTPSRGPSSTYTYDAAGRIATVRGSTNLNYGYDAVGRLLQRKAVSPTSSANTETRSYDVLGRLLSVKSASSSGYSTSATYTADSQIATLAQTANGNAASNTSTLTYDDAGRLISEAVTPAGGTTQTTTYGWDADANRVSTTLPDGSRVDSLYDPSGMLLSSSDGSDYDYDANGNLARAVTPSGTNTFAYDGWGQLSGATGGSEQVGYTRDALGRNTARTSSSGTERIGYLGVTGLVGGYESAQGQNTLVARDPAGALLAQSSEGSTTSHVFSTIHGDVGAALDETSGAVRSSTVFAAFGEPSTQGTAAVPLGFQSMMTDALTGLVDMGFRQYDPSTGRFTGRDDVVGSLASPVTLNRYTYANADPLNYFDPDGHWGIDLGDALDWVDDNVVQPVAGAVSSAVSSAAGAVSQAASAVSGAISSAASSVWNSSAVREARSAVSSTFREAQQIANSAAQSISPVINAAGGGHAVLDLAGMVPVVGEAFDVINGFWYLAEGDYLNAAMSLAAVVPVLGAGVTAAKFAARGYDTYRTLDNAYDAVNGAQAARAATRFDSTVPTRLPDVSAIQAGRRTSGATPGGRADAAGMGAACMAGFKSFSGDTEVLMADGTTKPIRDVRVGEEVRAADPQTGESGARTVTNVWVHDDDLAELRTGAGTVKTTADHPFWNATEGRWQRADELDAGDDLLADDGSHIAVLGLAVDNRAKAYNLTVDDIHTYFVMANGRSILVHNTGECGVASQGLVAGASGSLRNPVTGRFASDPDRLGPVGMHRPYVRVDTIRQVLENAARDADGALLDANTLERIEGNFHIGHVPGQEWWRIRDRALSEGWSRERLNTFVNDPSLYQVELPRNNLSHRFEMPR